LNNPNFENLPKEIVSPALNILGKEGEGKEAAKRILSSNKDVNSFLIFYAMKILSLSSNNTDRKIVTDTYNWLSIEINRSKGLYRLYFDVFYLPLFFIPKHVNRVKPLLVKYNPQGIDVKTNFNIYKIFRCFEEHYFEIGHLKPEVKIVCTTILQNWKAIIQWQSISNPDEIQTGHIKIALGHPELRKMAKNAATGIVQFCELEENHVFLDSNLYETAKTICDFDVYREWGEDELL